MSTSLNNEKQKGPLAYAPNVPKLQDGDTVEVKIDVTHKLFTVKRDVSFMGWLYGDSLPGPVLRIHVGQTVKFSMTDRSNDSSMMNMTMGEQTLSLKYYLVFHIIGTILGKVYLDENPANQFTGMQAVLVGPAQGAIMEFVLPEKGKYTFVDHSFASATMGATGVLAAD